MHLGSKMYYGMVKPVPIMLGEEASGEEPIRAHSVELGDAPNIVKPPPTHYVREGAMQSHWVELRNAPNIMDMGKTIDHSMT